jgi:type II secretory pathway pseudopilin PulG
MKKLNNIGDTIVEVLLAIAIVSAVLGGAFLSVNTSLNGARQAQERGEAMKLLEGQIERLKEAAKLPASPVFTTTGPFCINNAQAIAAGGCLQGNPARYTLTITRSGNTFTALAEWDKVDGGARDRVQLIYRIYPQP